MVEGDRSCPDSIVEGGAEYVHVQGEKEGGRRRERERGGGGGKCQNNLNEASLT